MVMYNQAELAVVSLLFLAFAAVMVGAVMVK